MNAPARSRNERPAERITAQRPDSLAAALNSIPGAWVRPPLRDHCDAVIVATFDEAFVRQVRAAVRQVRGVDVLLIGGLVAPGETMRHRSPAIPHLWAERWRDGELCGPEPRLQMELYMVRPLHPHYWIVRPVGCADDLFPDLLQGAAPFPGRALPMRREQPAAYIAPGSGEEW